MISFFLVLRIGVPISELALPVNLPNRCSFERNIIPCYSSNFVHQNVAQLLGPFNALT